MDKNYYSLNIKEVLKSLKTSEEGLTDNEAKQRSEKYGTNEIERRKSITPFKIFVRQFTSFIVIILLGYYRHRCCQGSFRHGAY